MKVISLSEYKIKKFLAKTNEQDFKQDKRLYSLYKSLQKFKD